MITNLPGKNELFIHRVCCVNSLKRGIPTQLPVCTMPHKMNNKKANVETKEKGNNGIINHKASPNTFRQR